MFKTPAHGTKQLRTPDRSYQQRQQQHHHHAADGSRGKQQQHHSPSASQRSSFERNQRSSSNSRPSGGQQQLQQQYVASDGSSTAAGTNTLMQQMQGGQAFNACAGAPTSHPMLPVGGLQLDDSSMQAQLQLAAAAGNNGGAAAKADLLHLVQTLMAQVSASQHEAAESTRAAVAAQHKLQLLENLFGSSDSSGFSGAVLGAAQNGPSLSPQVSPDAAMRSAGDWHTPAGGSVASASTPLPQLQPMLLQGAGYDNPLCPRRHSVDEILLRRAHGNNPGAMGGGGFGRNAPMWGANLQQQRPLSSLTEGVPAGVMRTVSGPSAASSDIEALAAAFAGAGLDLQSPGALGSMQPAGGGLVVGADAAALTSAAAAAAQLSGNSTSASSNAWLGMGCMQAAAPAAAGVSWAPAPTPALGAGGGGFNSFSHLPPIPTNYQQPGMMGSNSISAPQLQSDYLLHLHSLLQGGSTGVMHAGACAPRPPVRASFDTAAAYLPPLGGDLLGGEGLGRTPSGAAAGCGGSGGAGADMFAAAADDAAAASGSGSGSVHHSNGSPASSVQASVCVPDKLRNNPIGGAKQLGWF